MARMSRHEALHRRRRLTTHPRPCECIHATRYAALGWNDLAVVMGFDGRLTRCSGGDAPRFALLDGAAAVPAASVSFCIRSCPVV
jgi:hypothetical protein